MPATGRSHLGSIHRLLPLASCFCLSAAVADGATIRGTTTTQNGSVRLPGVEVAISHSMGGRAAGRTVSDANGRFEVKGLEAGRYQVVARLTGFSDLVPAPIALADGQTVEVDLDLAISRHSEEVNVVGQAGVARADSSASGEKVSGQLNEYLPVSGEGFHALLPIVPGVVRAPDGRISLKGARETQGVLKVGPGYANDPSTGNFGIELPGDSIESVEVVPNPYAAEDGRFSSTVVRIETRSGSNKWRALANGFVPIPCLTICDGGTMGITAFVPRGWVGGPLVRNKVFISQGIQYRYAKVRMPGLPEGANYTVNHLLDAFTRVDANLSNAHTLSATGAFFGQRTQNVGLSALVPDSVAPNFRFAGYSAGVTESATLSATVVAESSLTASVYIANTFGDGAHADEFTVDGQRGNFFNSQHRRAHAVQWTESITSLHRNLLGEHLVRAGLDVMWTGYSGDSHSNPVVIRRADNTVSQRLDFGGPATQQAGGADVAMFVQDRWRVSNRFRLEPGIRVERDGVLGRTNLSPRIGFVASMFGTDTGIMRGGIGTFYERTPLNVAAFGSFETATITRFAPDGLTPLSPPVTAVQRRDSLRTPRSTIWNIEYDHRIARYAFLKVNHLERRGSAIATLEPLATSTAAELLLASRGQSQYAETEVSLRLGSSDLQSLSISYVRSHAMTHQNVFDAFYGNFRNPIVRPDQYALSSTDVPNRLLIRGSFTTGMWIISPVVEIRDGFPYSLIDQDQDFVGVRNAGGRFPALATLDVGVVRSWKLLGYQVRYGVRGYQLLNQFMPRDVQNNIDSPALGTFYNSIPRRIVFTFTFLAN
jgi:hypothetical protein